MQITAKEKNSPIMNEKNYSDTHFDKLLSAHMQVATHSAPSTAQGPRESAHRVEQVGN